MSSGIAERIELPAANDVPGLERLWERRPPAGALVRGGVMPAELEHRYGGPLSLALRADRPLVIANFVSTLDGVVALGAGPLGGGGLISGHYDADHLAMGLLRSMADAVAVGAGTLRRSSRHRWTAGDVHPASAAAFARWRRSMGLTPNPTTVVVTGSGDVPAGHPALNDPAVPVLIATTAAGARRARASGLAPHVVVESIGEGRRLTGHDLVRAATALGASVLLCEGGPHLLGELVTADVLDELFLTVSPQLVGRDGARLGLVEGVALPPGDGRWHELAAVSRSHDHLFLRYRRRHGDGAARGASS